MTELVLKKIKHFCAAPWLEKEDDFLVLNDTGRIVGRIVMRARSPKGRPWVWIITAREQPPWFSKNNQGYSENNQGYSESREQAMKDFEAQYSSVEFHRLVSLLDSPASHKSGPKGAAENQESEGAGRNAGN